MITPHQGKREGCATCHDNSHGITSLMYMGTGAIGVPDELAHASLRFTVGRFTTAEEVDTAAQKVIDVVSGLRRSAMSR